MHALGPVLEVLTAVFAEAHTRLNTASAAIGAGAKLSAAQAEGAIVDPRFKTAI